MANLNIDTQSAAYSNRRTQFSEIVQFYGPIIAKYIGMNEEQKSALRSNDPFLDDILRFIEKFNSHAKDFP